MPNQTLLSFLKDIKDKKDDFYIALVNGINISGKINNISSCETVLFFEKNSQSPNMNYEIVIPISSIAMMSKTNFVHS